VAAHNRTFVGRGREFAILRDAVDEVAAGRGRLVLLTGEPGIGKTRLAEETAAHAASNNVRVLWGRCWEGNGAPAFWPWIQLIRESLRAVHWPDAILEEVKPGLAHITQIIPELRWTLAVPEVHEPASELPIADASIGPRPERFRLFDAIANLFKGLAKSTPLTLVIDDVHAADVDSLLMLRFLARDLKQAPILLVATYREVEVRQSPTHASLLSEIGREGVTIPLRGLSLGEVADFIDRNAQALHADKPIVSSLHRATDGNPFFLDEIVHLMIAERALARADQQHFAFRIPESIRASVRRRVAPLEERTKTVLTIASVIGNEFDLALVREASSLPADQIVDALEEAAAHALVSEGPPNHFRFLNAVVPDAIVADLAKTARSGLHRRIADAIEKVHSADLEPHLARLAYHYAESRAIGTESKILEYARRGAERARDQLAFAEAARLFAIALGAVEAASNPDDFARCKILLAMGEAQAQGRSLAEARASFEQAAQVARRLGRSDLLAQCALYASAWFGTFFTVDRAMTALVAEALNAADEGDSAVRASLMARLAAEHHWSGDRERGRALSEEAIAMARRVGDSRALVSALWVRSQTQWGPQDVAGRLAAATEIATLAESIGEYQLALRAHEMRFTAMLETGDLPGIDAHTREYETLAHKAGEHFGIVERFHAALLLLRGDYDEAERRTQELFVHAERRQDPALLACAQALIGLIFEDRGLIDAAQVESTAKARIVESPVLAPQYRIVLALIYAASGRRDEAAAELEFLAADDFASIPRDWNWLDNMRGLATLSVMLRDVHRASIVYEQMLPYVDRNITAGWGDIARGSAALYLGMLARTLGRLDDAAAHFEQALSLNRRMGARPAIARTKAEYARMLLRRGGVGDPEKADGLLNDALAEASALGMKILEARVRDLVAQAEGRKPEAPPGRVAPASGAARHEGAILFRKEGDFWTVGCDGDYKHIRDVNGLAYIARLLNAPNQEFHVLDLVSGDAFRGGEGSGADSDLKSPELSNEGFTGEGLRRANLGDAGEMLDPAAKAAYKRRLSELSEELDEAKRLGKVERASEIEREIGVLTSELARAVGLGGRDRRAGSASERARVNVKRAIQAAIQKIAASNVALGQMLSATIRTGTFCEYVPERRRLTTFTRDARAAAATEKVGEGGSIEAVAAAAVAEPNDFSAHAAPDGTVTILFSDVKDSTNLFEKLGDLRAQEIIGAHNAIVREQVKLHKGFEVKSMGDGFMIVFSSARRALLCAIGIQRAFAAWSSEHRDVPIRVRIGLHVGETIARSADFFGKTVIVAARIASLARGEEILVSSTLRDLTESAGDLRFVDAGEVELKGLTGKRRLYRALW
jgi:class 3 adenylate cyclase/tetratricopeptide (TPR) repeat protein